MNRFKTEKKVCFRSATVIFALATVSAWSFFVALAGTVVPQ